MRVKAVVLGASGFAGGELMRLLSGHGQIDLVKAAAHTKAGQPIPQASPGSGPDTFCSIDEALSADADLWFVSLPHSESMDVVGSFDRGRVIDLGGDFRLSDPDAFRDWYGRAHSYPDRLGRWVYGAPELNRAEIASSDRVANPGCYAAAALLALHPLIAAGNVSGPIHIDGKSGVSGAGRATGEGFDFAAANENVRPYTVTGHKHIAEIEEQLNRVSGDEVKITFVPHLIPMTRGILVTCIATTARDGSEKDPTEVLLDAYGKEPFVRVLTDDLPQTRRTAGTNLAEVACRVDPRTGSVISICAIDNLGKGAAGQAIQNANIMFGLEETAGLTSWGTSI